MIDTTIDQLATLFFACAVLHTFCVKKFLDISHRYPKDSFNHSLFHFLGEVEVVFGIWAFFFYATWFALRDFTTVLNYHDGLQFDEPLFVFCIMVVAATRPVMELAKNLIVTLSGFLSFVFKTPKVATDFFVVLTVGPLLGSFITEPAAMTVTGLLLYQMTGRPSDRLMYLLLAVLFVNISIGGAMTSFAAPPILMVAKKWNWDLAFMLQTFAPKAIIAVTLNSFLFVLFNLKKFSSECRSLQNDKQGIPYGVTLIHYAFLGLIVLTAHHPKMMMGLFLFFLGITVATRKYQNQLRLKEGLLVAFFLGGIVVFGKLQSWWLGPVLKNLDQYTLYIGATLLTAVTDNAALTYLGSQVEGLSDTSKYFLVAGALAGGGLTIIANAPNAAGYGILKDHFPNGINPLKLLIAALIPTLVAFICFAF